MNLQLQLDVLSRDIEQIKKAPLLTKAAHIDAALDSMRDLLQAMVNELEGDNSGK